MPPYEGSRHLLCTGLFDDDGVFYLSEREPYRYRALPDNTIHVVQAGETLFELAGRYYAPKPRACGFWWVIADFQPIPIHDPTLALEAGTRLVIPSLTTLDDRILAERRRREFA